MSDDIRMDEELRESDPVEPDAAAEPVEGEMRDPGVLDDPWASYRSEDLRESARSADIRDPGEQQRRLATMLERARFRVRLRGSGAHEIRKMAERLRSGDTQLDEETAYQLEQVVESFMTAVQDAEATIKGLKRYVK